MTEVECIIEGCPKTFTSKQGIDSHFAFTSNPPHPQAKIIEMKEAVDQARDDTKPAAKYPDNWDEIREKVLARDNYQCQRCGSKKALHVHHQIPKSNGGSDDPENLITFCQDCHSEEHGFKIGADANSPKIGSRIACHRILHTPSYENPAPPNHDSQTIIVRVSRQLTRT